MAKANLQFVRLGNDGYEYARREDGVWFFRQGYCGVYGWAKTKWQSVDMSREDDRFHVNLGLQKHSEGDTVYFVGFGSQIIITDGKGLRLP